ncbi:MBL fold metallo-hydrolase [Sulfurimonas sp. HSL-1716]|uniref:MBL fold metallo-hydrolase n=1 Tax=Hydrocurvibacter sulfurireducens TaxID=3131937 RepID=UPI0031F9FBE6
MNEITILGAYGTKGEDVGTSAFYIDEKNVLDAGNLLIPLKERSAEIEFIWLSHSHLDHIIDIAYILDSYFAARKKTLKIRGLPQTLQAVKEDFLNDRIWPDFSSITLFGSDLKCVEYEEIEFNKKYELSSGTYIEAYKTDHTVPSCGYIITKKGSSVIISSDTYSLDSTIEIIDSREDIKSLVVECSFPSRMEKLAIDSKHLTPKILFEKLKAMKNRKIDIYINHIKPLFLEEMTEEIERFQGDYKVKILEDGRKIIF